MTKTIKIAYTDEEFRALIREEATAAFQEALNKIPGMPQVQVKEQFINISEAAEFLNMVSGTLYNLVNKQKIPFHKAGRKVLFKKSELSAWMKTGKD